MIRETVRRTTSGWLALAILIPLELGAIATLISGAAARSPILAAGGVLWIAVGAVLLAGLFLVNPNEARVLQLFGDYKGSAKEPGLRWASPFYSKRPVSLRLVSFESGKLKVNDADGNPVEIAAIVVWKVVDSAQAVFEVDDFAEYVRVQSEAALRNLATRYPYDAHEEHQVSLRGATAQVADHLKKEIEERVQRAGVEVLEARISHLAYAPEIAQAMLQRQQASAIIAARSRIVDGAVGMVEMALQRLAHNNVVHLDEERKAAMVSNLLVVLCGERATQPVVNTGTIYQ
jgi:regulator of protease activity HflC (stomatin/prohibitin superfamily)